MVRKSAIVFLSMLILVTPLQPVFAASEGVNVSNVSLEAADLSITIEDIQGAAAQSNFNVDYAPEAALPEVEVASFEAGQVAAGEPLAMTANLIEEANFDPSIFPSSDNYNTSADPLTGAMQYSYPIKLPSARAGMTPSVSLNYSSQNGAYDNYLGYQWELSNSYIERRISSDPRNFYTENRFDSSLSGELKAVNVNGQFGEYGARYEGGGFLIYEYNQDGSWTVTDKSGTKYYFGTSADAREGRNVNAGETSKWYLESVVDLNGNRIDYTYTKDAGRVYPSRASYGGNNRIGHIFEVIYSYQDKLERNKYTSYKNLSEVSTNKYLEGIDVYVTNRKVREYELQYNNLGGVKLMLDRIAERGFDQNGTVTEVPMVRFGYETVSTPVEVDADTNTALKHDVNNSATTRFSFADLNGDGFDDFIRAVNTDVGKQIWYYMNDGAGANFSGVRNVAAGDIDNITLIDPDGDGAANFFIVPENAHFTDLNGDGLIDYIQKEENGGSYSLQFHNIGQVGGNWYWRADGEVNLGAVGDLSGETNINAEYTYVSDVNADGMSDKVFVRKPAYFLDAEVTITMNNSGTGFTGEQVNFSVSPGFGHILLGAGMSPDRNGDGYPELMLTTLNDSDPNDTVANLYFLSTGSNGWSRTNTGADQFTPGYFNMFASLGGDGRSWKTAMRDHNGRFEIVGAFGGTSDQLLTTIEHSQGGTTEAVYTLANNIKNENGIRVNQIPSPTYVVTELVTRNDRGDDYSVSYEYEGGDFYIQDAQERRFSGFSSVTKTEPSGVKTKTFYYQGNGDNAANGEVGDSAEKIGQVYKQEVYGNDGRVSARVFSRVVSRDLGNGRYFNYTDQVVSEKYDNIGGRLDVASTFRFDANGNQIEQINYGEVQSQGNGDFVDRENDTITERVTYALPNANGLRGLPVTTERLNENGQRVSHSMMYYDNEPFARAEKGNLTRTEIWTGGENYAASEFEYTVDGNLSVERDPLGRENTYVYDAFALYPTSASNPLGHQITAQYDYTFGKPFRIVNSRGGVVELKFDGFGRTVERRETDPNNPGQLLFTYRYTYTDFTSPRGVKHESFIDANTSHISLSYFDQFGRLLQQREQTANEDIYSVRDFHYNSRNQLAKDSVPYESYGMQFTLATEVDEFYTNYTYSPLGEVERVENSLGFSTAVNGARENTLTGPNGNVTRQFFDAHGRLISVVEEQGFGTIMRYYYDANGNIIQVKDFRGDDYRDTEYDPRGLVTRATHLYNGGNANPPAWSYSYNEAGELVSQISPAGDVITYEYDALGRVTKELVNGNEEKSYIYDNCTNGTGLLCSSVSGGVITSYQYDALGKISHQTRTVDGVDYHSSMVYDLSGHIRELNYPGIGTVHYDYGTDGNISRVRRESGGNFEDVVSEIKYNPMGQIERVLYPSGIVTSFEYNNRRQYELTKKLTLKPNGAGVAMVRNIELAVNANEPRALVANAVAKSVNDAVVEKQSKTDNPQRWTILLDEPVEQVNKRTATSKTFLIGHTRGGEPIYELKQSVEEIHYKDILGRFQDIELLEDKDNGEFTKHLSKYEAKMNTSLKEDVIGEYKFEGETFKWKAPKKESKEKTLEGKNRNRTSKDDEIFYAEAVAKGIGVALFADNKVMYKDFVIDYAPALKDFTDKEGNASLSSDLELPKNADVFVGKEKLEEGKQIFTNTGAEIKTKKGTTYLWNAVVKDAKGNTTPVQMGLELNGNVLTITKVIPSELIKNSVYPIRTDAALSFVADASQDGYIYAQSNEWFDNRINFVETLRNLDNSGQADRVETRSETSITGYAGNMGIPGVSVEGRVELARAFIPFDTSALPDDAVVREAELSIYIKEMKRNRQFGETAQWSVAVSDHELGELDGADFTELDHNMGTYFAQADFGEELETLENFNQFRTINLVSNLERINTTGVTNIGIRSDSEMRDFYFEWQAYLEFASADTPGTAYDPTLSVVYTSANAPERPSNFLINGNPSNQPVATNRPVFSVRHNDPDAGDRATHYRARVYDAQDHLVWDSNKVELPIPVVEGNQTVDLPYTGENLIADGRTYKWDIKLYEDYLLESLSLIENVSMVNLSNPSHSVNCGSAQPTHNPIVDCASPHFSFVNITSAGNEKTDRYNLQVSTDANFNNVIVDTTGRTTPLNRSERSHDIVLGEMPALQFDGSTYYWRVRLATEGNQNFQNWQGVQNFQTIEGTELQHESYSYDASGNMLEEVSHTPETQIARMNYVYDKVHRLTSATITDRNGVQTVENYSYDTNGNITNKNGQNFQYNGVHPHQVTQIGNDRNLAYDINGNMTDNGDGLEMTWNYENRLTEATKTDQQTQEQVTLFFSYDQDGNRVMKQSSQGSITVYPHDLIELTEEKTKHHIYAGSILIATVETDNGTSETKTYNAHTDHLGSSSIITNENGEVVQRLEYTPYGETLHEERNGEYNQEQKFTGHRLDEEIGIYYARARYYDPSLGRFLSIDPWGGDISDPQSLNKYSYARNNPVRYVDPTGEVPCDPEVQSCEEEEPGFFGRAFMFVFGGDIAGAPRDETDINPEPYSSVWNAGSGANEALSYTDAEDFSVLATGHKVNGEEANGADYGFASLGSVFPVLSGSSIKKAGSKLISEAGEAISKIKVNFPWNKSKKVNQLTSRGWSQESISDVVNNPYTTRKSVNRETGNSATVYYYKDGSHVIVDDVTSDLIQMSDRNNLEWKPDKDIDNPYIPNS